ncbi:NGG1p interacting factor NIF3, partial [Omnitrophica bacterium]|nr:NGG1p interacting factor NIF3 [Candidatus Omnitrophota bacterium]
MQGGGKLRLEELYKNIVNIGMKHDPRPKKEVRGVLLRNKKSLGSLKGKKRAAFDMDSLFNPYNDTRILYGDREREISRIMVGIDIEAA